MTSWCCFFGLVDPCETVGPVEPDVPVLSVLPDVSAVPVVLAKLIVLEVGSKSAHCGHQNCCCPYYPDCFQHHQIQSFPGTVN